MAQAKKILPFRGSALKQAQAAAVTFARLNNDWLREHTIALRTAARFCELDDPEARRAVGNLSAIGDDVEGTAQAELLSSWKTARNNLVLLQAMIEQAMVRACLCEQDADTASDNASSKEA